MTKLDFDAIRKAYPETSVINDDLGAFDASGNAITLDQSKIDAARSEINAQAAATLYQRQRTGESGTTDTIYLPLAQQLDMQYWDAVNGTTTWKDHIAAVKAKYPKPS